MYTMIINHNSVLSNFFCKNELSAAASCFVAEFVHKDFPRERIFCFVLKTRVELSALKPPFGAGLV